MANIVWSGNQVSRAGTEWVAVTAVSVGGTITATINSKTETYTSVTGDTLATAAAGAVAAFQASPIPEFALVAWANRNDDEIWATTPADGRPVTVTYGAAGGCTVGSTTTVAPTSSHTLADAANFVGGVAPGNGDTLVLQGDAPDILYGLDTLTSNTVAILRYSSYTGSVGLSDWNPLGFLEYLPTRLETAGTSVNVVSGGTGVTRLKSTAGSAVTLYGRGAGPAEVLEVTGLPANSVIDIENIGLVVAPLQGDASVAATALVANLASIRTGPGGTITTATIKNATGDLGGSVTTLTVDRGATVTARLATAITTLNVPSGTYSHNSTGSAGTITISGDGVVDLSDAPATVAVTGITCNDGGSFRDPWKRASGYSISGNNWLACRSNLDIGTSFTIAVT